MDHRFLALTLALAAFCAKPAFALYVQATPPAGWATGTAGNAPFSWAGTANPSATYTGSQIRAMASINMQGRSHAIASSFKLAPNAARVAATAIMANPYVRTAATVALWLGLASLAYDPLSGLWTQPDGSFAPSTGREYLAAGQWHGTSDAACQSLIGYSSMVPAGSDFLGYTHNSSNGSCLFQTYYSSGAVRGNPSLTIQHRESSCPSGWYITAAGCVQTPPPKTLTQEQAVEEITKHPMPADLPRHIPTPLPVESPEIQPVFIPTGDPVPNPSFDPSKAPSPSNPPAAQPGVEVRPAPLPGSPWQVDVVPVNRPIPDPTVVPDRNPVPLPNPNNPGNGDPPENTPRESDLCEKYPTILACQELKHEEDDIKLPTKAIEFEFNPIPGFQGSKTCPAFPNVGNLLGGKQISWQPFCDSLAKISNLLLAFAWASAAFIMLGYGRSD